MKKLQKIVLTSGILLLFMIFSTIPMALADCPTQTSTIEIEPGDVFESIEIYYEESGLSGVTGTFEARWTVISGPAVDVMFGDYYTIDNWYYANWAKGMANYSDSMTSPGCVNWTTVYNIEHYFVISNYYGGSNATVQYSYKHTRDLFIPGFELISILMLFAVIVALAYQFRRKSKNFFCS